MAYCHGCCSTDAGVAGSWGCCGCGAAASLRGPNDGRGAAVERRGRYTSSGAAVQYGQRALRSSATMVMKHSVPAGRINRVDRVWCRAAPKGLYAASAAAAPEQGGAQQAAAAAHKRLDGSKRCGSAWRSSPCTRDSHGPAAMRDCVRGRFDSGGGRRIGCTALTCSPSASGAQQGPSRSLFISAFTIRESLERRAASERAGCCSFAARCPMTPAYSLGAAGRCRNQGRRERAAPA